jgi:hypothetical protein
MSRPTGNLPGWNSGLANDVEPSSGEKAAGYAVNQVPTSGKLNWLLRQFSEWCAYVLFLSARVQIRNLLVNGDMYIDQRRTIGATAYGNVYTTGPQWMADRWHAFRATGSGVFGYSPDRPTGTTVTPPAPCRYPSNDSNLGKSYYVQEVDREFVTQARGKTLRLNFQARVLADFSGALAVRLVYGTGVATETVRANVATANYTTGSADAISQAVAATASWAQFGFTAAAVIPAGATTMAVVFQHTPSANPATGAADGFSVDLVQLSDRGDESESVFTRAGDGTYASEFDLCRKYFEASNPNDIIPGYAGSPPNQVNAHLTVAADEAAADGAPLPLGSHPSFKTEKAKAPSVTVYSATGNANHLTAVGGEWATVIGAGTISTTGFTVNNASGAPVTPGRLLFWGHWVADAEI